MPRYQEPQVQATNHRQNHESPRKGPPSPKKEIKVNLKLLYFCIFIVLYMEWHQWKGIKEAVGREVVLIGRLNTVKFHC